MPTTQAIIKAAAKFERLGYRVDSTLLLGLIRQDAPGQGVACGGGFIARDKKCSKEKAKTTPKEALKRTAVKQKDRQKLRAEVERRPIQAKVKPQSKPKSTKGAQFLGKLPKWMREHEGAIEIAKAVDFNDGWVDTGSHNQTTSKSNSLRNGMVQIKRLNLPSKRYPTGSVSFVNKWNEKHTTALINIADGVWQKRKEDRDNANPASRSNPTLGRMGGFSASIDSV